MVSPEGRKRRAGGGLWGAESPQVAWGGPALDPLPAFRRRRTPCTSARGPPLRSRGSRHSHVREGSLAGWAWCAGGQSCAVWEISRLKSCAQTAGMGRASSRTRVLRCALFYTRVGARLEGVCLVVVSRDARTRGCMASDIEVAPIPPIRALKERDWRGLAPRVVCACV